MYGKKSKIRNILTVIVIVYSCTFFVSCISNPRNAGTEDDILAYQRRITELETEVRELRETIAISNQRLESDLGKLDEDIGRLEEIRTESAGITDSIDRIIYLFDHYESIVEQIVRDYSEIRARVEAAQEGITDSDNNLLSDDFAENPRLHTVR